MNLIVTDTSLRARRIWESFCKRNEWSISFTGGPVVDFPVRGTAIDTLNGYIPKWEEKSSLHSILQKVKYADNVYILLGSGVDNEFIAGHLYRHIIKVKDTAQVYRGYLPYVSRSGVQYAVDNASGMDGSIFEADIVRRMIDHLISSKLERQILRMLGLRNIKLYRFSLCLLQKACLPFLHRLSIPYQWKLSVAGSPFCGYVASKDEARFAEDNWCNITSNDVRIEASYFYENPPPPLNLSSLLQICAKEGYEISKIVKDTYLLYDYGFITEPSFGTFVHPAFVDSCIQLLKSSNLDISCRHPHGNGQECLRPVRVTTSYLDVPKSLRYLYKIIWQYSVAAVCSSAYVQRNHVSIPHNTLGSELSYDSLETVSPGFHALVGRYRHVDYKKALNGSLNYTSYKSFDYPDECGIISYMSSTFPSVQSMLGNVDQMCKQGFIKRRNGSLVPTMKGLLIYGWLKNCIPECFEEEFSSVLERRLERFQEGLESRDTIMRDYHNWIDSRITNLKSTPLPFVDDEEGRRDVVFDHDREPYLRGNHHAPVSVNSEASPILFQREEIPGVCVKCGSEPLVTAYGRYGLYLRCSSCFISAGDWV